MSCLPLVVSTKDGEPIFADTRSKFGVRDAESFSVRHTENADLALVAIVVKFVRGLPRLDEREDRREWRHHFAVHDCLIRRPRLAVVREVRTLDRLEFHPEMAVVVFDHVPTRRGTRHDRAASLRDEDTRTHGRATGMFKDNVGVSADEGANVLTESAPLTFVLGVFVLPKPVVIGATVNDVLAAQFAQRLDLARTRHDSDWRATGVEDVLHCERADASRRSPNEYLVALGDRRAIV